MSHVKKKVFRKKDYLRILKGVVDYCLYKFGYRIRPFLLETKLERGKMMVFCESNRHYAILYDWEQFRQDFKNDDYETQEAYATAIIAHEMRHYYQVRQIFSKNPCTDEEKLAKWRENHSNAKVLGENGCTLLEFFMQPMELDATLYSYYFVATVLNRAINYDYIDKDYLKVLKQEYISIFGQDDEDLYIFDVEG